MEPNVLPAMPIDFTALIDQIIPMLANVIGSIAPFLLVYILAMVGIRYLANTFKGNDPTADQDGTVGKPWEGHSDSMYEWYKDSIDRKGQDYFDERAPDWVKARMEYEEIYDGAIEKERRKQLNKMVEADIKRDIAEGKDIFEQRKSRSFVPIPPPSSETEWFGEDAEEIDEEEEPHYPEFEG